MGSRASLRATPAFSIVVTTKLKFHISQKQMVYVGHFFNSRATSKVLSGSESSAGTPALG